MISHHLRCAVVITVLAIPALARAEWPRNGRPVSEGYFDQQSIYACTDGSGGVLVAWANNATYAQHILGTGEYAPGWNHDGVLVQPSSTYMVHYVVWPAGMAPDGQGGAYVALFAGDGCEAHCGGEPGQVYLQRITASGGLSPGWPVAGVPGDRGDVYEGVAPSMAADSVRGVLVAWRSAEVFGPTHIAVQSISPTGERRWGDDGVELGLGASRLSYPSLVSDGHGGAFVFWAETSPTSASKLRAQHLSADGVALWGQGVDVSSSTNSAPVATEDGSGGAIVVWSDSLGGSVDLFAARITRGGGTPWRSVRVCDAPGDQLLPAAAASSDGGLYLAWQDHRDPPQGFVYAQRLTHGGQRMWSPSGVPACTQPGSRAFVGVVGDGRGGVYLAWADSRPDVELFASRFDGRGELEPGWIVDGTPVSSRLTITDPFGIHQSYVEALWLVPESDGSALVAWQDFQPARTGNQWSDFDYAMRLGPDGPAAPPIVPVTTKPQAEDLKAQANGPLRLAIESVAAPGEVGSRVRLALPTADAAQIETFDVAGRRMLSRSLALAAGRHEITLFDNVWVPNGVYFIRLTQGVASITLRIAIVR